MDDRLKKRDEKIRVLERQVGEYAVLLDKLNAENAALRTELREKGSELPDYQAENARLIEFAQKVADSRTKFAPDAKALLGQ